MVYDGLSPDTLSARPQFGVAFHMCFRKRGAMSFLLARIKTRARSRISQIHPHSVHAHAFSPQACRISRVPFHRVIPNKKRSRASILYMHSHYNTHYRIVSYNSPTQGTRCIRLVIRLEHSKSQLRYAARARLRFPRSSPPHIFEGRLDCRFRLALFPPSLTRLPTRNQSECSTAHVGMRTHLARERKTSPCATVLSFLRPSLTDGPGIGNPMRAMAASTFPSLPYRVSISKTPHRP
jgi:hypothetical protein